MRDDAESHGDEDRKKKELVETRNEGDSLAYNAEKTVKDLGEKLSEEDKNSLEAKIKDLRETLTKDDVDAIKQGIENLNQALHGISEKVYAAAKENEASAGSETNHDAAQDATTDDTGSTVDAEFRDADQS